MRENQSVGQFVVGIIWPLFFFRSVSQHATI